MEMWLAGAVEITALCAQLEQLVQAWLPAEADANYWYAIANNPELAASVIGSYAIRDASTSVTHARNWSALPKASLPTHPPSPTLARFARAGGGLRGAAMPNHV